MWPCRRTVFASVFNLFCPYQSSYSQPQDMFLQEWLEHVSVLLVVHNSMLRKEGTEVGQGERLSPLGQGHFTSCGQKADFIPVSCCWVTACHLKGGWVRVGSGYLIMNNYGGVQRTMQGIAGRVTGSRWTLEVVINADRKLAGWQTIVPQYKRSLRWFLWVHFVHAQELTQSFRRQEGNFLQVR